MGLECRGAEGVGNREGKEQLAPIPATARRCDPGGSSGFKRLWGHDRKSWCHHLWGS